MWIFEKRNNLNCPSLQRYLHVFRIKERKVWLIVESKEMFLFSNTHLSPWPQNKIRGVEKPKPLILFSRDDEHLLIQHYCQSLNQDSPLSQPRSPAQILISLESEERGELERILADLEEENRWVFFVAVSLVSGVHTLAHEDECQESSLSRSMSNCLRK